MLFLLSWVVLLFYFPISALNSVFISLAYYPLLSFFSSLPFSFFLPSICPPVTPCILSAFILLLIHILSFFLFPILFSLLLSLFFVVSFSFFHFAVIFDVFLFFFFFLHKCYHADSGFTLTIIIKKPFPLMKDIIKERRQKRKRRASREWRWKCWEFIAYCSIWFLYVGFTSLVTTLLLFPPAISVSWRDGCNAWNLSPTHSVQISWNAELVQHVNFFFFFFFYILYIFYLLFVGNSLKNGYVQRIWY